MFKLVGSNCVSPFSLDKRSIVVFRIGLGILLTVHFIDIIWVFPIFYTNSGVLPSQAVNVYWDQVVFPWFFFTDSSLIGRAILSLGILGGVSICFGRFSRRWLIYVWVVLCSLQARNPLVVHAGDGWLRILVFLAALLPLDREQLIKVSAGKMNSQLVESPYAFLVIGQLVLIYFVAGASKLWNGWWDGRGIYNAFHLLIYAKSLAKYIREWPTEVLSIFNWMILIMELVISHLLWCSGKWWRFRIIAILVFLIFHLSCLFVLELGFLPWVGIIHLLLLFPSQFWDLLPDWFSVEEQATDLAFSQGQRALISLVYFLFLSLWVLNGAAIFWRDLKKTEQYQFLKNIERSIGFQQNWELFPSSSSAKTFANGWFVMRALKGDGIWADLPISPTATYSEEVVNSYLTFGDNFWRKYLDRFRKDPIARSIGFRPLSYYLCRNLVKMGEKVTSIKLEFLSPNLSEDLNDSSNNLVSKYTILTQVCEPSDETH